MLCFKNFRCSTRYGLALVPLFAACSDSAGSRPSADAGADQVVVRGANVSLSGSASSDLDGEIIDFQWSLLSAPEHSTTDIAGDDEDGADFTPDRDGVYTIQLVVVDSQGLESAPDIVSVTAMRPNERPVAHMSVSGSLLVGSTIIFEGEDSYDPDGEVESYNFEIVSFPEGSDVAISPLGHAASITPDITGIYVVGLTVNDGTDDSVRTDAIVDLANMSDTAPVAVCDPTAEVVIGEGAPLDGTLSFDPEGATLSYSWAVSAKPIGSDPTIDDADSALATLNADRTGTYRARLVVNDGLYSSPACETTVEVVDVIQNNPPVSNAGIDQIVSLGETVTLDGSGSSDADGDALLYFWSFDSVPNTSSVIVDDISPEGDVSPQFSPDVEGTFNVRLTVSDNKDSDTDSMIVLVVSEQAPIADAGPDQSVTVGSIVNLDGTQSTDPNGDPITYLWSFASLPSSSGLSDAEIFGSNGASPQFVPDVEGVFELALVVDDGSSSDSDEVIITATNPIGNTPPVADAGSDQSVALGDTVSLDGTGSSDADGDPLLYGWSFVSVATGSSLTDTDISNIYTATPSFTPDVEGVYVLGLGVTDGTDYGTDTIVITVTSGATNTAPVADAGADQTIALGDTVTLDGSGSSDADGDPLSYGWAFVSVATGSSLTDSDISGVFSATPSFTPDIDGTYVVGLGVTDGTDNDTDSVIITVTSGATNTAPVADAGADQTIALGDTATLDGSGSSDADGDPLSYGWAFVSVATGSSLTDSDISGVFSATPSFTPDIDGTYVVGLGVTDGTDNDTDSVIITVTSGATNTAPVADAGADQTIALGDTATLDGSGSSDADGDPLSYGWAFVSVATGSSLTDSDISGVFSATPSFTPDIDGTYVVGLGVTDGTDNDTDSVIITVTSGATNTAPVADAGADQTIALGDTATLDGSGSSDADGDPLSYGWAFVSVATGSSLTDSDISGVFSATPSFTPDIDGTYVVGLGVTDGTDNDTDSVQITVTSGPINTPPVADMGIVVLNVNLGDTVNLDGSGSSDADGDPLTYMWLFASTPSPSNLTDADITGATSVACSFTPDVEGTYRMRLRVYDGADAGNDYGNVVVTGSNNAPIADAGASQTVFEGDTVTLNGTNSSDPDGDPLSYGWTLIVPIGSNATLASPSSAITTFVADVKGAYVAALLVSDGSVTSNDVTTIGAISGSNKAPTAVAGLNQSVVFGDTVVLDGTLSSDPDGDPLTYSWSFTRLATGSTLTNADISGANTDTAQFTPDVEGAYRLQLMVDDGAAQDLDRLTITVYSSGNAPPVADAGNNRVVGVGNTATMDGTATWDPDGDPLVYDWSFVNLPSSSLLNDSDIIDYDTATPSFTPDVEGAYLLMLTVTDGIDVTWDIAGVNAIVANNAPIASAGADQLARVGDVVTVDGSTSSDADGDPLTYAWTLLAPLNSSATLSSTTDVAPTFTADVVGTFILLLQVNDGSLSDIDRMEVVVQ